MLGPANRGLVNEGPKLTPGWLATRPDQARPSHPNASPPPLAQPLPWVQPIIRVKISRAAAVRGMALARARFQGSENSRNFRDTLVPFK
jgi:hypothetical protein